MTKALVRLRLDERARLIDLDDPHELARRGLLPSRVATGHHPTTQRMAVALFDEGASGLLWWSTLEAGWTNAALFYERVLPHVTVVDPPKPLTTGLPEVQEAAERLGVEIR